MSLAKLIVVLDMSEKVDRNVEITVSFGAIPTIKQAIEQNMFKTATLIELLVWFPALWTAGRLGHVYFSYLDQSYHVSNLSDSDLRHQFAGPSSHNYTIWVSRANLVKAMVLVDEANAHPWFHPWQNCTHTLSMLIYGEPNHYGWLGSFGWSSRSVLRDVQTIVAAQR